MDFLRPENLLRYGYKDCLLCEVERKGEEKRCRRCSGRVNQRDRLLWEINRGRIRRISGRLSLIYPGFGHFYSGRILQGIFWAMLIPLSVGLVLSVWQGPTIGHAVLLLGFGMIYYLSWLDARRGFRVTLAPCQEACPSHLNVPDYIALVREGRPLEALALVHDRLPFAAFCGRACPHPCEQKCVRNEYDAPISIMAIKRYAADLGYEALVAPSSEVGDGVPAPRVAVIGAGPAGLSAANTLARLGCRATVFDANEEPGGMMRYSVAEFRFPYEAGLSDARTILARGVHFRGGKRFGRDFTFADLAEEGFDAVLVAVGTNDAVRLPGVGGGDEGFIDALMFLSGVRRGKLYHLRGRLVVIGGGNVAIDVARVAVRLGAEDVTIACLESRETMPAFRWEVEDALAEGVKLLPGTAVKKFLLREGRVSGFEALEVERIEFDAKGRIVPHTVLGSEFEVRADTVVMAIGSRADMDFIPPSASRKPLDAAHHVYRLIFREKEIRIPAYMCGDCVRGPGTVVEASASGRAAALNVFEDLCVQEVRKARFEDNYRRAAEPQVTDRPEWRCRRPVPRLSPEESRRTFQEVEKRFAEESVHHEAERCARCNLWL
ncbi:MAG: FAD-dependent oxidoreductase [Deltaproteobacteria bacterium]|nr:FAD-dependent oxidoreductase [Deltaproteobacteria bacterium]